MNNPTKRTFSFSEKAEEQKQDQKTIAKQTTMQSQLSEKIATFGDDEDFDDDEISQPNISNSLFQKSSVTITIKSASGLRKADFFSASDPYIEVYYKKQLAFKTEVVKDNNNPIWNQAFKIVVDEIDMNEELTFMVYDWNRIMNRELIGQYKLTVKELFTNPKNTDIIFDLFIMKMLKTKQEEKQQAGKLKIMWNLKPFSLNQSEGKPIGDAGMAKLNTGDPFGVAGVSPFFQKYNKGKLILKVKVWNFNGNPFPINYYLTLKLGKTTLSCKRLVQPCTFQVIDIMETFTIIVSEDKKMAKDPEITQHQIRVCDLFSNNESIVYQDVFHKVHFTDIRKQCEVYLSFASKYIPDNMTEQQIREIQQEQQSKSRSRSPQKDIEGLLKKKTTLIDDQYPDDNEDGGSFEIKKKKLNSQDKDFFNLDLATLPSFASSNRGGLLMIRANFLNLLSGAEKSVYIVFKTSKSCVRTKTTKGSNNFSWGETYQIKLDGPFETVQIKVYSEGAQSEILAEGTLVPKDIFATFSSWKKVTNEVKMELKKPTEAQRTITLDLDLQFRVSKFTRMPRGKLEVILLKGLDLKCNGESFKPIMEFRIDTQRIQINEDVNPHNAQWRQKLIEFETQSIWELLEVRIFDLNSQLASLQLLGSFQRALNSIFFSDVTSIVEIDLSEISEEMSGLISLQLDYYPHREGTELEKHLNVKESKTNNLEQPLTMIEKKRGICYLTLFSVEVINIPKDTNYNVENIRLEILYDQQRCLSRITSDLSKTSNKEQMEDMFRIVLNDVSVDRLGPEKKITINAFDVDYKSNFDNNQTQVKIGTGQIDPTIIRVNQGMEMHYQVTIQIPPIHFMQKASSNNKLDILGSKGGFEEEKEIMELLNYGDELKQIQGSKLQVPELLLTFHVFYLSTSFTKQPVGLMTFNDLTLMNLHHYIADLQMKDNNLYCLFRMNKNKNSTSNGKHFKNLPLNKDHLGLFNQEYDPIDVLKCGRLFMVNSQSLPSYYKWQKQLVLPTSNAQDELEIRIVLEKSIEVPVYNKLDEIQKAKNPNYVMPQPLMFAKETKKTVLAQVIINIADISYFMDQNPLKEVSLAMLMDFQANDQVQKKMNFNQDGEMLQQIRLQRLVNSKDLTSKVFANNLILIMDVKLINDQQGALETLRGLNNIENIYVMPREIVYNDYINNQFDDILKKKKTIISRQNSIGGASPTMTRQLSKKELPNRHLLVEMNIQNLNSIIRQIKHSDSISAFIVFEPLLDNDSLKSYMSSVVKQYKGTSWQDTPNQMNRQTTLNSNSFGFGNVIEDFFAKKEDLIKPEDQISEIFIVSDFEIHSINEILEAWVPISTQRMILSLVVEVNGSTQLEKFRQLILTQSLTRENTLLGTHKSKEVDFKKVKIYQTIADFSSTMQGQDQQLQKSVFYQCCNLAELSSEGNLLQNPMNICQTLIKTRLSSSKFIDTPSGQLNVVLKKMSHNSNNFNLENYIQLELKSRVDKSRINTNQMVTDAYKTEMLGYYKQRTEKYNKTSITLNEVCNFIVRHFSDYLVLSIYNQVPESGSTAICIFSTKIELNNLELNEDKFTITVVGTTSMRSKSNPVYYTFEMDLFFRPKLISDPSESNFEFALMNYKLLRNKENISQGEEEILKMMIERMQLAKNLTPSKIRMRKARFLLRNMIKTSYQSLSQESQVHFRVHNKSFLFNMNDPANKLSEFKEGELYRDVKIELNQGRIGQAGMDIGKFKNLALEKNATVEKSNNLMVQFMNNIQLQSSASQKFKYKKLVIVATQDQQTVFKQSFDKKQLIYGEFLQGLIIIFKNVNESQTLTFRLLVEEEQEGLVNIQQAGQSGDDSKLNSIGMGIIKLAGLGLKTWIPIQKQITIAQFNVNMKLTLQYSDFTKNPHKVVNFTFHRVIQITPDEFVMKKEEQKDMKKQIVQKQIGIAPDQYQYKIVLKEDSIIQRRTEPVSSDLNVTKPPSLMFGSGMGLSKFGSTMKSRFQSSFGSANPLNLVQVGSINQMIFEQVGEQSNQARFKVLMEFDNCIENEGNVKDQKLFDINQYGKLQKKEMEKITINNTLSETKVIFKLCIDNSKPGQAKDKTQGDKTNAQGLVVIGIAQFYLSEVQALPNQQLNFFIPIKSIEKISDDVSALWALKHFQINDLYMLASIKITDKTFGELNINLSQIQNIPKTLQLRYIQWKIQVRPSSYSLQKVQFESLMAKDTKPKDFYSFPSERVPYEINDLRYKIDREMTIHLQLKDIFSDQEAFLRPATLELYQDQDTYLIFELMGFDDNNYEFLIGQKQISMISMIQKQILHEREKAKAAIPSANKTNTSINDQKLQTMAQTKIDNDFSGCSARFQKLFTDTYVRFNNTKDQINQQKQQKELLQSQSPEKKRQDLPEGYQVVNLKYPETMENNPYENGKIQLVGSNQTPGETDMIVKIEFNFSYKKRTQYSNKYHEINEEIHFLERIKERKNVNNLLDILEQVKTERDLTHSNLKTLSLVLASESCMSLQTQEEMLENQTLPNIDRIITYLGDLFKQSIKSIQTTTIIEIMRILTYLKIICDCHPEYQQIYQKSLKDSCLIETMVEIYQNQGEYKSKELSKEFVTFLASVLNDFPDVYFDLISGVRLDPLLEFIQIDNKDFNIVNLHAKLLNSIGQCIFKFKTDEIDPNDRKVQLVKMDMFKIAKNINEQLLNLINGLTVYKNDYEVVSTTLCQAALQFIHVAVLKNSIVKDDSEGFTLPDIMMNLFKILVDGIISQLSIDFITDLKKRLNYEMSLIKSLDLRTSMILCFDDGVLIGMMKRLTQHFDSLLAVYDPADKEKGIRFFDKTKLIFEFFAKEFALVIIDYFNTFQNAFAENNRELLKKILNDKSVDDHDFVIFLHNVVKIDAEIESHDGDENSATKQQRKTQFMESKYGQMTRINKFSLSRIEWLDNVYVNENE